MKAGLLLTGNGALAYLTSHPQYIDDELIRKFENKGITKFIVYEIPIDEARSRYGGHFNQVIGSPKESSDLRILDYKGNRAFQLFKFDELGEPFFYEA